MVTTFGLRERLGELGSVRRNSSPLLKIQPTHKPVSFELVDMPAFEREGGTDEHDWMTDLRRRQYADFRRWRALGFPAFEDPECRCRIAGLEQDIALS